MKHGELKDQVYIKKENEKMKLKIGGGSWTINLGELPKEAIAIVYITSAATYKISTIEAFEKGFELTLGGERKLVVPLKYWEKGDK